MQMKRQAVSRLADSLFVYEYIDSKKESIFLF